VEKRRIRLLRLIDEIKPGIIILDVNEAAEVNAWTFSILAQAKEKDFCIFGTLHPNPSDKIDRKARGHLGSELMRRAESVLSLTRDESGQRTVTMNFTHGKNRNAADNLESYFSWNDMEEMFISCPDSRTYKPKVRERQAEILNLLAGKTWTFADLRAEIVKTNGGSPEAAKQLMLRLKKQNRLKVSGHVWEVVNAG
jgi:hypothetical protein